MKKTLLCLCVIASAILLASCGESKSESDGESDATKIKVESGKISGELGKYFEIVARTYKIEDNTFPEVNFEIKRIAEGLPEAWAAALAAGADVELTIHAQFLDEDGGILDKEQLSVDEDELAQLSVDDTTTFSCYIDRDDVKKVKGAKFSGKYEVKAGSSDSNGELEDGAEEFSKSMEEVDKALEGYGKAMEALGKTAKALKGL